MRSDGSLIAGRNLLWKRHVTFDVGGVVRRGGATPFLALQGAGLLRLDVHCGATHARANATTTPNTHARLTLPSESYSHLPSDSHLSSSNRRHDLPDAVTDGSLTANPTTACPLIGNAGLSTRPSRVTCLLGCSGTSPDRPVHRQEVPARPSLLASCRKHSGRRLPRTGPADHPVPRRDPADTSRALPCVPTFGQKDRQRCARPGMAHAWPCLVWPSHRWPTQVRVSVVG